MRGETRRSRKKNMHRMPHPKARICGSAQGTSLARRGTNRGRQGKGNRTKNRASAGVGHRWMVYRVREPGCFALRVQMVHQMFKKQQGDRMIRRWVRALTQWARIPHLEQHERFQLEIACAHREMERADAIHRSEITRSLSDWERKGGPEAWRRWVEWHRGRGRVSA